MQQAEQQTNLRSWQHIAAFLVACAILISRRPEAIFHPQFFAEDGHVWYADAYNFGWWTPLFRTQDGYFQTLPRLAAALALLVPLALAPLVLNCIAIAVQALPVNLLLSSRSSDWGSLRTRAAMAGLYLAIPNCREILAIITSCQWVLALCVFLILTASSPRTIPGRIFDFAILSLCGLTGPFCFFLFPVAFFIAWKRSGYLRWAKATLLGVLCLVQAWGLLVINPSGRAHAPLGATPGLLVRILGGHVFLATLLGGNGLAAKSSEGLEIVLLCAVLIGVALIAYSFAKSNLNQRLFIALAVLMLAASFVSPAAYPPPGVSRWELMARASGIRYWYFPCLAFSWSFVWGLQSRVPLFKTVCGIFLCLMSFGIIRDWQIRAFKDLNFTRDAIRFEAAPVGSAFVFPENPQGWNIRLIKHSTGR